MRKLKFDKIKIFSIDENILMKLSQNANRHKGVRIGADNKSYIDLVCRAFNYS